MLSKNEILNFNHPAVVRRFARDFPAKAEKSQQLFNDLMAFFWLSKKHSLDRRANPEDESLKFVFIMDEEMRDIDQIWHIFLLYTKDYMDFCEHYFHEYLHHLPDIVPTFEKGSFDFETNLEKFLSYVYDNLGPEVVERWFSVSSADAPLERVS